MATNAAGQLSGEQIAAIAYALPTLAPQGLALGIVVASILLAVVTTIVVCLRIWVRMGLSGALDKTWSTEDYLLVMGFIPFLASVVFAILAAYHGTGMRDVHLPSPLYAIRAGEYIIYWEVLYFISSTIVKIAIGFTCIRIDQRKRVTYPISVNISVMTLIAVLALVFVFINCKPFAATWNPALGTCQKVITLETVSYIVSAVQAVSDWVCAIIPCYIVSTLQMPRRRKISVICILGLGIFASLATIVRVPYLKYYNTAKYPNDFLWLQYRWQQHTADPARFVRPPHEISITGPLASSKQQMESTARRRVRPQDHLATHRHFCNDRSRQKHLTSQVALTGDPRLQQGIDCTRFWGSVAKGCIAAGTILLSNFIVRFILRANTSWAKE
ncbi:hypothetical protein OPT61_g1990 [Boeremia exigua]|uniref:Uncharacterized protein n=1 Tax=Boeremia exigua TaxID=749465 RepID=A0ACC2IN50_9PLEO|nr:hypothetical protein OPT61_g1990 [Boeremia exigua]